MATNVAKRLASLSKRLSTFDQVVVTTAGKIVADSLSEQVTRDTHGGTMRNVGRSGVSLDVQIPRRCPTRSVCASAPRARRQALWTMLSTEHQRPPRGRQEEAGQDVAQPGDEDRQLVARRPVAGRWHSTARAPGPRAVSAGMDDAVQGRGPPQVQGGGDRWLARVPQHRHHRQGRSVQGHRWPPEEDRQAGEDRGRDPHREPTPRPPTVTLTRSPRSWRG